MKRACHLTINPRRLSQAARCLAAAFLLAPGLPAQTRPPPGPANATAGSDTTAKERADSEIKQLEEFQVSSKVIPAFVDHIGDLPRGVNDVQPYYIFDAKAISDSGAANIEDFMKQRLTMNSTAQTASQGYATGSTISSINLRGLGATQTLILIDGRRAPQANISGAALQADVNGFPLSMIERIEVLPSSASAIYGGSAVGGVVNVILKKDYTGGLFQATYTNTFSKDTPIRSVALTYGFALEGGRTHFTITANAADTAPLQLRDRTINVNRITTIYRNNPANLYSVDRPFAGATPNIVLRNATITNAATGVSSVNASNTTLILKNGTPLNSTITYVPYGTRPGDPGLAAGLLANAGKYNLDLVDSVSVYGLQAQLGTVPETSALMIRGHRDMTKWLQLYADLNTNSAIGDYTFTQFGNNTLNLPANAPTNPFQNNIRIQIPSALATHQTTGLRNNIFTTGAAIKLPFKWKALLDYTWSRTGMSFNTETLDGPSQSLVNTLQTDLHGGALNPFADTILYPPNLQKYSVNNVTQRATTLNDVSLRSSGPIPVPRWLGTTNLTTGLEHRKEGLKDGTTYSYDYATLANAYYFILFGQVMTTDSVYAELQSELVEPSREIPWIHSLSLQLAGRTEKYAVTTGTSSYQNYLFPPSTSTVITPGYSGGVREPIKIIKRFQPTNPTIGLKFQPIQDISLRASYATAFLPPTFAQLLPAAGNGTGVILTPVLDPTRNDGITYRPEELRGGNPAVDPQNAKSLNLGFVYQPLRGVLKGFRFNLEYYKIKEDDVIGTYPNTQFIVNFVPSRVKRDAAGTLTQVDNTAVNLNQLETDGWDVRIDYSRNTRFGDFSVYAMTTRVNHFKQRLQLNGPMLEYRGFVSSGGPVKNKVSAGLAWDIASWTAGWNTTYTGAYIQFGAPGDPTYNGITQTATTLNTRYTAAQLSNTIPGQMYHDVYLSHRFGSKNKTSPAFTRRLLSGITLFVGVQNAFNSVPPMDAYYGNTFYSPFGNIRLREYTLRFKKEF